MKEFIKGVLPYVIIIVCVLLVKIFVVTPIKVNGTSMYPSLSDGDIMILDKISYRFSDIKRFDIVVINSAFNGTELIKRVIGLPGDVISYKDGKLLVNEEEVSEDFLHKVTEDFDFSKLVNDKVPDDFYFVVGDNRTDSYDSRYFGFVPKKYIEGKTSFVLFPFSRIGTVK